MNDNIIELIVKEEWEQFQVINNEVERAPCQDDYEQFHIMRKSQFMTWPKNIINSYYNDLLAAKKEGRNLLFERFAWMMEKTMPEKCESIHQALPVIAEERKCRVYNVAAVQARWGEEFAKEYPNIAGKGRVIYSKDDTPYSTSIETYTIGEMLSYSEDTEKLYSDFIISNYKDGNNVMRTVRENLVKLYGYKSLEHAEKTQLFKAI